MKFYPKKEDNANIRILFKKTNLNKIIYFDLVNLVNFHSNNLTNMNHMFAGLTFYLY